MSIVKQPPDGYGHEQSVELLTTNDIALELETQVNEFLWNELLAIYTDSGMSRKYKKASLSTWESFIHFKALAGYSIWKYPLSDMKYNILNLLYMDEERLLENRGQATSESLSAFDRVLLYNGDATPIYNNHTTEAGTEQGTPFLLMDSINDYLYIGADEKFNSLAFAFSIFGSGHALKVEYYKNAGTPGWEELTIIDDTNNFESDGRISFTLPSDWVKCAVDGEATPNQYYYIRISTTSVPTIVAQAYSVLPGDSVPTLLAMSRTQLEDKEWCWCYFNEYVYMTIKNEGGGYYEGTEFIKDSSSDVNKENYFESNHNYKTIYEDENYTASAWAPEHIIVSKGTSFPSSPVVGQLFYRTDLDKWYIYRNGATPFWDEVKTGAGAGDMLKSTYDTNANNIVDNSEKLEGSTKNQVQDHNPKAHVSTHKAGGSDEGNSPGAFVWYLEGEQSVETKTIWLMATKDGVLTDAEACIETAGTGANIIIDIEKSINAATPTFNTIFSTKLTIDDSEKTSETATTPCVLSITTYSKGDIFRVKIDQIGSGVKGSNLTIHLHTKIGLV